MDKFQKPKGKEFIIEKFEFDNSENTAHFHYKLDEHKFTEKIKFNLPKKAKKNDQNKLNRALFYLHIALGISYFKLAVPSKIIIKSGYLDNQEIQFWTKAYTKGLGEFFYVNKIDYRNLVNFENFSNPSLPSFEKGSNPISPLLKRGVRGDFKNINTIFEQNNSSENLLCLGGGKDSLLAAEILDENNIEYTPLIFGNNKLSIDQSKLLNKFFVQIERKLDPKLLELNKTEKYFNGHVPFSLILAMTANIAAILGNYKNIIVANEHSANFGNVPYLDETVNHQWSKSLEAEKMINNIMNKEVNPLVTSQKINYFSILRPFWELAIVKQFVKRNKFFKDFASCNRNFTQTKTLKNNSKWCGDCPKCAFAFTVFSAFLPRKKLIEIFGKNLFEDKNLLTTFKELWGEINIKPLECVGEPKEVITALALAIEIEKPMPNEIVLLEFAEKFLKDKNDYKKHLKQTHEILNFFGENNLPKQFEKILKNEN